MNDKPSWQDYLTPGYQEDGDPLTGWDLILYTALAASVVFGVYMLAAVLLMMYGGGA